MPYAVSGVAMTSSDSILSISEDMDIIITALQCRYNDVHILTNT